MQSYGPATVLSLIGHGVLLWLVIWGWQTAAHEPLETPDYVKATLIDLEALKKPEKKIEIKEEPQKQPDKQKEEQAKQQQAEKEKQKKLAEEKRLQELAKQKEAQRKAEEKRQKEIALKKKQEEEAKKKKEEERKQAEEKRQQEELRRQQEALERQALAKQLEQEQARIEEENKRQEAARKAAEEQAAADQVSVTTYKGVMAARIEENWSRPPSARNNMVVVLRIQLVPTGEVIAVEVEDSSGNEAFDRSAINAVKKTERFPELKDMSIRLFDQYFRKILLSFSPEDLRQ